MDDSRLFERTVSSAIQYSGPVFDVYSDTVELCNKKTARRDYLKHRGAVAVHIHTLPRHTFGAYIRVPCQRPELWQCPPG